MRVQNNIYFKGTIGIPFIFGCHFSKELEELEEHKGFLSPTKLWSPATPDEIMGT